MKYITISFFLISEEKYLSQDPPAITSTTIHTHLVSRPFI